jgi:hypothetical protein
MTVAKQFEIIIIIKKSGQVECRNVTAFRYVVANRNSIES